MPNYLYDENDEFNKKVAEHVKKFMVDNQIHSEETIYQTDRVIENAYDFIAALFNMVESKLPSRDEI